MNEKVTIEMHDDLQQVRRRKPLIHHLTNYVVANETANLTLVWGALPVMSHAEDEVEEMVGHAQALLLNIGTLTRGLIDAMIVAGTRAKARGIPIVLDPVGVGATSLRTESARRLMREIRPDIVRGNAAEIAILSGYGARIAGVESIGVDHDVEVLVKEYAFKQECVVAATGAVDYVSDGSRVAMVHNGHPLLGTVTGTGCMATTSVAVFSAVNDDMFAATVTGLTAFGVAGEVAAEQSGDRPGTFHMELYNAVYALDDDFVRDRARIEALR